MSPVRRVAVLLAVLALQVFGARAALAQPAEPTDSSSSAGAAPSLPSKRSGFELLALGGYGASTAKLENLEMQPYEAHVGLDLGFAFRSGFRLGWTVGYGFGRSVHQHHEGRGRAQDFDFDADSSSLNVAISLGYDVRLDDFLLRYSLGFGGTFMRWDFGGVPATSVYDRIVAESPTSGFFVAPGLALLWPHDTLVCGVGFDYLVQASGVIPPGLLGKVLVGVKL